MKNINIRSMNFSDTAEIAKIHVSTWQIAYHGIVPQEYLDSLDVQKRMLFWESDLKNRPEIKRFVAEVCNEIVGFVVGLHNRTEQELHTSDCELWAIYVDQKYFRTGIGSILFKHFVGELKKIGKKKMCLWALEDNDIANDFYRKNGGIQTPVKKNIQIGGKDLTEISFEFNI